MTSGWGDPNVIYVDAGAEFVRITFAGLSDQRGLNSGTSWKDAYRNLTDAIERINNFCGEPNSVEIWVADGRYNPSNGESDSFVIPDGVKVFGGFGGYGVNETSRDQRDFNQHKSILSGVIGQRYDNDTFSYYDIFNNTVVTMGRSSLLDGFTVEKAGEIGIDASNVTSEVKNCIIENCFQKGVFCRNGNLSIQWCKIRDNLFQGIHNIGSSSYLMIENSTIYDNRYDGILTDSSVLRIRNSLIYSNGSGSYGSNKYYGIYMGVPSNNPEIYNNTIVHNVNEGIRFVGGNVPDIRNNILWYNNADAQVQEQMSGIEPNQISCCCIYDHIDPNNPSSAYDAYYNIDCEPNFAYPYIDDDNVYDNFHLAWNSPCVNMGTNAVVEANDMDMDTEDRIVDGTVDIGADEVYSCDDDLSEDDIYHPYDLNADGAIDLGELDLFSRSWQAYDPNLLPCDLNENFAVDMNDLVMLAPDWLWHACWNLSRTESQPQVLMMSCGEGGLVLDGAEGVSMSMSATAAVVEPTVEEQIDGIEEAIDFLNDLWKHDKDVRQAISKEDWEEFMDSLKNDLYEFKAGF